jgi:hypothetical protein
MNTNNTNNPNNPEVGGLVPPSGRELLAYRLKANRNNWPEWVRRGGAEAFEAWVDETADALRRFFGPPAPGKPRYVSATVDHLRGDSGGNTFLARFFVAEDDSACNVSRLVGLACGGSRGVRLERSENALRVRNIGPVVPTIEARLLAVLYGPDATIDWPNRGVRLVTV